MSKKSQPKKTKRRSDCPISNVLDALGDKWTLLVIRDLFLGRHKFKEFRESPEGIPTNILSDRLKKLEAQGIIESRLYSRHPPRFEYLLTQKGRDLGPILKAMMGWAEQYVSNLKVMKPVGPPSPESSPEASTKESIE